MNWSEKKTWSIVIILLLAGVGVILYSFFFQNSFSKENVLVKIEGPKRAKSGKDINYIVTLKNNSKVAIENLQLSLNYPNGVFNDSGKLKEEENAQFKELLPGREKSKSFSGKIFGRKGEIKKIKSSLSYSPKGLSTTFRNSTEFSTRVANTPVVFRMETPSEVSVGKEFTISLSYQSGFPFVLENSQLRLDFPEGFKRLSENSGNQEKKKGKIIYNFGALNEDEGGEINIKGKLTGEVKEEKMLKANFGRFDMESYKFVPLASAEKAVQLTSSTLDVFRKINGNPDYAASYGDKLHYIIEFKNTGEQTYRDLNLGVELKSNLLDFSSLEAPGGEVGDKKVTYSHKVWPSLLFLGPHGEGKVGFNIEVKEDEIRRNGIIKEKISFGSIEKSFKTKISSKKSLKEKVYSKPLYGLSGDVRSYYEHFEFANSDNSINANADSNADAGNTDRTPKKKLFVVEWNFGNRGNILAGVNVQTTLPKELNFKDRVYPEDTDFNFNKSKRKLTLNIGAVPADYSHRYYFALAANSDDVSQAVSGGNGLLLNKVNISGKDNWTEKSFKMEVPAKNVVN